MDKYNVIDIAKDLNSLELDMQNWSLLPHKIRLKSNDDCIRMHGCTVRDFYNVQKLAFMKDDEHDTASNIKSIYSESCDFDNIDDRLVVSANYQEDPLIVIIDPVDSMNTVIDKYHRFNMLSKKFRALSNAYSINVWNMNVINMYLYMISKNDDEGFGFVRDNIKFVTESTFDNSMSVLEPVYDYTNKAFINRDVLLMGKYLTEFEEADKNQHGIVESVMGDILAENEYNRTIPTWYSPVEIVERGAAINPDIFCNPVKYYHLVKEVLFKYTLDKSDENAKAVLSLGWNYNVPVKENSVTIAKERNAKHYDRVSIYDIRSLCEDAEVDDSAEPLTGIQPIYIIIHDNIYLSFNSNITNGQGLVYEFDGKSYTPISNTLAFRKASLDNESITVYAVFIRDIMHRELYDIFRDKAEGGSTIDTKIDLTNLLQYKLRPSDDTVQFMTGLIESIIASLYYSFAPVEDNIATDDKSKPIYKIYQGLINEYNEDTVNKYIDIILTSLKQTMLSKGITSESVLDKFIERLIPNPII